MPAVSIAELDSSGVDDAIDARDWEEAIGMAGGAKSQGGIRVKRRWSRSSLGDPTCCLRHGCRKDGDSLIRGGGGGRFLRAIERKKKVSCPRFAMSGMHDQRIVTKAIREVFSDSFGKSLWNLQSARLCNQQPGRTRGDKSADAYMKVCFPPSY